MKKAYTIIALAVLIGSMAGAGKAQSNGRTLVANIPFQFNVGDKTLPAGEYTIAQTNPSSDRAVLRIRTKDGNEAMLMQMNSIAGNAGGASMLVLHRYGNKYFLAQVWIDGASEGLVAPASRAERATQKELTALGEKSETIALRNR
jgi:hypothetical protein